ncbi:uncharacterized protein VICG_01662 [Vittaforma corneae ATCC 50505]|uniref:Transmembrane protein n=1 Tax=Vittaforma corneae (strain ATCC 50505) TaxID=993615 RepID=L2GKX9_VITCO|nr:uncharacterized protein VICG_01662 [Vittaforma corneae ATCC 50505]ELA41289.1 hypothetical protein VICG_01662 [Vittaforma corneae ATCC 50505]
MRLIWKNVGFLFLSTAVIILLANWPFNFVIGHMNHIPGFTRIEVPPKCCIFDSIKKSIDASYEPAFVKISRKVDGKKAVIHSKAQCEGDGLEISLLISSAWLMKEQTSCTICKKTAKHLFDVFSEIKNSIDVDNQKAVESKLEFYSIRSKMSDDSLKSAYFICSSGKLICISVNGWIFPLVCQFTNLAGRKMPLLNLTWNFSTFRTHPVEKRFVVDVESPMKIPINYLCQREVCVIKIEKERFLLNSSKFDSTISSLVSPAKDTNLSFDEGSMLLTVQKPASDKFSLISILVYASYAVVTVLVFLVGLSIASTIFKNFVNQPTNIWPIVIAFFILSLVLSMLIISQIAFVSENASNI